MLSFLFYFRCFLQLAAPLYIGIYPHRAIKNVLLARFGLVQGYTRTRPKRLDARLFQAREQRSQHLQLVRTKRVCDGFLSLLPQGIGTGNSLASFFRDPHDMLSPVVSHAR